MIQVGLVGFGLSGRHLQAPFFQLSPFYNLASIVTSQEIPKNYFPQASRVESFDAILEDASLDLISICSPSNTHYDYAKRAILAGKHVLLEKPMTATVKEAEELIALAKTHHKVLYVFQNRRFDGDFMTVKKVIESGILGDINTFEAHFDRYKPNLNPKKWKEEILPANGILYDLGAHLIDQSIFLFGKPQAIGGEVFTQRQGSAIDDAFDLRLDYGTLKVTLKSSLMIKDQGPKYTIHGSKGSFTKWGMDVQEDHLVSGFWPDWDGFGKEAAQFDGKLVTHFEGLELKGTVETLPGNWGLLLQNLHEVITQQAEPIVKLEEILEQLKIINSIKP
jgi:scyllo-inositol 2-dehydrogenase (NADP+)